MAVAEKEVDLTGISVGGEKLTKQHLEEADRHGEIMSEMRREINGKSVIRRRYAGKDKPKEETKKVSKRGRYLTPNEIRKEYGLMTHPYSRDGENILYLINTKGPISILSIEEELGKKKNALSGVMAKLFRKLGPKGAGMLKRAVGKGRAYVYESVGDWSVEAAYKKTLGTPGPKKKPDPREMVSPTVDAAMTQLEQTLSQAMGLDVKVHGRIEIVFGWKKF